MKNKMNRPYMINEKNIVLLFVALICATNVFAYDCKINGIYYNLDRINKTAEVTNETGDSHAKNYSRSIVIPPFITYHEQEYSVTLIGDSAFSWCTELTSVTLPNSITTIKDGAFLNSPKLTSITIPSSVTKIGDSAFFGSGLTSIVLPNSVTKIGSGAFAMCSDLTSIILPNAITTLEDEVFELCAALTSIIIPNSVKTIGIAAFAACYKLASVTLPHSVTTIKKDAFSDCDSLKSITIPHSTTMIENGAFYNCDKLQKVTIASKNIKIGATKKDEETYAFEDCHINDFYCGKSVDLTHAGGNIRNVHRLSEEELSFYASFSTYAQKYVESHINEWQRKGEFEKSVDWQKRVNETARQHKIDSLISVAKKQYLTEYTKHNNVSFTLGAYDADNEVYLINGDNGKSLLFSVPIADASYVKQNWNGHKASLKYDLLGDEVIIATVSFTFPNKKTYTYKSDQKLIYATADINYNFAPIELPEMQTITMGGAAQMPQVPQGITELVITTPFDLTPMSSVLVSYKNIFGKYEMPDKDETFPYVVMRVTLTGNPQLVRMAKQSLALDLGQSYITEQTVPMEDKILFLVPTGVKSIYLTDGNGQRQLIYSGRLIPNTIYDGVVTIK